MRISTGTPLNRLHPVNPNFTVFPDRGVSVEIFSLLHLFPALCSHFFNCNSPYFFDSSTEQGELELKLLRHFLCFQQLTKTVSTGTPPPKWAGPAPYPLAQTPPRKGELALKRWGVPVEVYGEVKLQRWGVPVAAMGSSSCTNGEFQLHKMARN